MLEKIMGLVLIVVIFLVFGSAIVGMAEQAQSDSIRYSQDPMYNQPYIAPADEVAIELMERDHE